MVNFLEDINVDGIYVVIGILRIFDTVFITPHTVKISISS